MFLRRRPFSVRPEADDGNSAFVCLSRKDFELLAPPRSAPKTPRTNRLICAASDATAAVMALEARVTLVKLG